MITAKCQRCEATAESDTFKNARQLIDHAVGRSRGIPCGDSYGAVIEIKDNTQKTKPQSTKPTETKPKTQTSKTETPKISK